MSLLIAPYNNSMRLGCGFNSYKQQICVNNAVIKDNKAVATEDDLVALKPAGTGETKGKEVSQQVTWSAKFVDKASDVFETMNISGQLEIKFGKGSVNGKGHYLNVDKMKESDVNYLLQVKVVNQVLVAQDVTKFNAIPNIPTGRFTDVYGDSFISGFLSGGEFYCLISIKVKSKSENLNAGGAIGGEFGKGPLSVNVQAQGGFEKLVSNSENETTISVCWTGGGNIRPAQDATADWTLELAKKAANQFPQKVAEYPQRTHAILTKYTSLRSYQELSNKGTPLDYENAGVYTSALLDAYVDYKQIWSDINIMEQAFRANRQHLLLGKVDPELVTYHKEAEANYLENVAAFFYGSQALPSTQPSTQPNDAGSALMPSSATTKEKYDLLASLEHKIIVAKKKYAVIEKGDLFEPPMKPNGMIPYPATLIGLDRARRDCRWEMIKLVKEVDAVTNDPHIATDTNRIWQYLSPALFRTLLPQTVELPPYSEAYVTENFKNKITKLEGDNQTLENTKIELTAKVNEQEQAITKYKSQDATAQATIKTLKEDQEKKQKDLEAYRGKVEALQAVATSQEELKSLKDEVARNKKKIEDYDTAQQSLKKLGEDQDKSLKKIEELEKAAKTSASQQTTSTSSSAPSSGLAAPIDVQKLPSQMREWVRNNPDKLQNCIISGAWAGKRDSSRSMTFKCSLDDTSIADSDPLYKITVYRFQQALTGFILTYASLKTVSVGNVADSIPGDAVIVKDYLVIQSGSSSESVVTVATADANVEKYGPNANGGTGVIFNTSNGRVLTGVAEKMGKNVSWRCECAPSGYVMRGMWSVYGEAMDFFGIIWGKK